MFPLGLAPLPVRRLEGDAPAPESAAWGDFVSEEAIREVNAGACYERMPVAMEDLHLSSCDDDFAGRRLGMLPHEAAPRLFLPVSWPEPALRQPVVRENRGNREKRKNRATPPSLPLWDAHEAGLAARGGYRWWVPGLIGVAATFVLGTMLLFFSREPAAVIGASTQAQEFRPEHAHYFEPQLDERIEMKDRVTEQPVAATGFSFPR